MSFIDQHIFGTELVLLEPICSVRENGSYDIYKSKLFPGYFDANIVFVKDISERNLSEWENIFDDYFEEDIYQHKNFQFATTIGNPNIVRELKAEDYDCCYRSYMVAENIQQVELPKDLEVVKLIHRGLFTKPKKSRKAWKTFKDYIKKYAEHKWFYKEGFRKTKYVTRSLNIEWFVLRKKNNKKIVASLGLFLLEDLARLQDVKTVKKYQRQGYATLLVRHAVKYALKKKKIKKVVVCVKANYHAVDLYAKCGFRHQFDVFCATKA